MDHTDFIVCSFMENSIVLKRVNILQDMNQRYDALLQMYGEKVEEANELRLDLEDVKDMYKAQVIIHTVC